MAEISPKAFKSGDEFPAKQPGKLRIYSMRFCPYAQRTTLVLAHKNIPHEVVHINLGSKPDWFLERSPFGKVPVLEIDDKIIYESVICNDWLDAVYPDNKLNPSDPYEFAQQRQLLERHSKICPWSPHGLHQWVPPIMVRQKEVTGSYSFPYKLSLPTDNILGPSLEFGYQVVSGSYALMKNPKDEELFSTFNDNFSYLEKYLTKDYFGGSKLGMLDYFMWPHMERMGCLERTASVFTMEKFPKVKAWMARMVLDPAVKATMFDTDSHLTFYGSYLKEDKANVAYDLGL